MKNLWNKIKCFLGFCKTEITEVIKDQISTEEAQAIRDAYHPKPRKTVYAQVKEAKLPKGVVKHSKDKSKIVADAKNKVKRAWYNNGKEQKLIPVDQKIQNGWTKGKLPKKDK